MPATVKIAAVLAALSILGAFGIWFWKQAGNDVRISIERQDNAAGDNADDARTRFDTCADGLWDYGAGKCRRTSPRGRD
ncbi:hypothetical protein [Rhizobium sp. CSW-27]|uniref:hypothetical protein n=1 Tax=Rhizobium sp. CSW-27 TaxID=2839985 RepID=UPI001C0211D0|nr:hypothetical protein [Rhizobium sp. CSW-27]MBT9373128.1 hypothetical protein [Rhizobium sp. CSW-27]